MAETQVENQKTTPPFTALNDERTSHAPDAKSDKRPVGRPRKYPPAEAPPANGAASVSDQDFFNTVRSFPKSDWEERKFMYLYRTGPQINLGRKGEWNIERYSRAVDTEDIMQSHGSGSYKIMLVEWEPETNQTRLLRTHYFTIMNMNYPPKVPMGTWIDKAENAEWLWAKPYLEAEMRKAIPGAPPTDASAAMFNAAVSAVEKLRPNQNAEEQMSLAQLVIQTMQTNQEQMLAANNPAQFMGVVDKIIAAVSPKTDTPNAIVALVTGQLEGLRTELAAERAFARDLLTKLTEKPNQSRSLKDEIVELKEITDTLGLGKKNSGSAGTDWGSVARDVGMEVVKTLGVIASVIATKTGQPQPARRPISLRPEITAHTDAAPTKSNPAPAHHEEETTVSEQDKQIAAISAQFGGLFDAAAPFLVDQFTKGFSGMEFREWFTETYGTYTYSAMKAMSPQTIAAVIELRKRDAPPNIQEQLEQLRPPDKVMTFIQEFLSDAPVDEDEDEPAAPEPTPAPATAVHTMPQRNRNSKEDF